jgi:hypothetical protein
VIIASAAIVLAAPATQPTSEEGNATRMVVRTECVPMAYKEYGPVDVSVK